MENMVKNLIGSFEIGKRGTCGVVVSDPCYNYNDVDTFKTYVKSGMYNAYIEQVSLQWWGNRIATLSIVHNDYVNKVDTMCEEYIGDIFVDSGTAGIYDKRYFKKHHSGDKIDEEWYDKYICNELDKFAIFDGKCVISSSGLGDGAYPVYGVYNENDDLISLKIEFIENEYDDIYGDED
jgi:hypothetical protein